MRTLLALYICIYILFFIYEERPHKCRPLQRLFPCGTLAAASSKKSIAKSILCTIYIYISVCIREESFFCLFSRSESTCFLHRHYPEVQIDPKNRFKARAQVMGKGRSSVRCTIVCKVTGNRAGRTWGPFVSGPQATVRAWSAAALAEEVTT